MSQSRRGSSERRVRVLRMTRRVAVISAGSGLIIVGIVGLVLPFLQGVVLILLGLVLVSLYSPVFERLLLWLMRRFPSLEKSTLNRYKSFKQYVRGGEEERTVLVLCIVHNQETGSVLLGMKKRGFGAGKWNGFGGKVADGEDIEKVAHRELWEEAGIQAHDLSKRGILDFEYVNDGKIHEVHIFLTTQFVGVPTESEEMRPQWFAVDEIPFERMWVSDGLWLSSMCLAGKKFKGRVRLSGESILDHSIYEAEV